MIRHSSMYDSQKGYSFPTAIFLYGWFCGLVGVLLTAVVCFVVVLFVCFGQHKLFNLHILHQPEFISRYLLGLLRKTLYITHVFPCVLNTIYLQHFRLDPGLRHLSWIEHTSCLSTASDSLRFLLQFTAYYSLNITNKLKFTTNQYPTSKLISVLTVNIL